MKISKAERAALIGAIAMIIAALIGHLNNKNKGNGNDGSIYEVEIITPQENERVHRESNVRGVYEDLPRDRRLWLYVFAPGIQRYFFDPIIMSNNGSWVVTRVIIGSIDDVGHAFKIGVVIANKEASREIEMNPHNVNNLPDGTEVMHEITIFRE